MMQAEAPQMALGWENGCAVVGKIPAADILALRAEASEQYVTSQLDDQQKYLAGRPDGSFATPSRVRFAYSSSALQRVHQSSSLLDEVREAVGVPDLTPSRASYTYYIPGGFLGIHRDVRACTVTLLIAFTDNLGPLYFAPSRRGADNDTLKEWVDEVGFFPTAEAAFDLPMDRFLAIDGRTLPHWRALHEGPNTGAIATLCYYDPSQEE